MNTLKHTAIGFVVGALMVLPAGTPTAQAEDWEDRWEDYQEELQERREEARERYEEQREEERERYEEWREDREEALEDLREEGPLLVPPQPEHAVVVPPQAERAVVVPRENWRLRNRRTRYWQNEEPLPREGTVVREGTLPPPRRYTREERRYTQQDRFYNEPAYRDEYRSDYPNDGYRGQVYYEDPPVYDYYSRPEYRYYGTPNFGYSEYGRERSVRVGPVQVYWNR